MPATPVPADRPRTVTAAFWCWIVAAVLSAAAGLMIISERVVILGILLFAAGLAMAFLCGRARRGDIRFARAALGLAMATVVFLALLSLLGPGFVLLVVIVVIVILEISGAALSQRPASQRWYESRATS